MIDVVQKKKRPAKIFKKAGIKKMSHLAKAAGIPYGTLNDWKRTRPRALRLLAIGLIFDESMANIHEMDEALSEFNIEGGH